jgi:hypothetical protein
MVAATASASSPAGESKDIVFAERPRSATGAWGRWLWRLVRPFLKNVADQNLSNLGIGVRGGPIACDRASGAPPKNTIFQSKPLAEMKHSGISHEMHCDSGLLHDDTEVLSRKFHQGESPKKLLQLGCGVEKGREIGKWPTMRSRFGAKLCIHVDVVSLLISWDIRFDTSAHNPTIAQRLPIEAARRNRD